MAVRELVTQSTCPLCCESVSRCRTSSTHPLKPYPALQGLSSIPNWLMVQKQQKSSLPAQWVILAQRKLTWLFSYAFVLKGWGSCICICSKKHMPVSSFQYQSIWGWNLILTFFLDWSRISLWNALKENTGVIDMRALRVWVACPLMLRYHRLLVYLNTRQKWRKWPLLTKMSC